MKVKRTGPLIEPDIKRVLLKPFDISSPNRTKRIVDEIISMKENIVLKEYSEIRIKFVDRHKGLIKFFENRFEEIVRPIIGDSHISSERKILIGAYFSHEYSLEAAALFNPSMIWHPDQSNLPPSWIHFQRYKISSPALVKKFK